MSIFNYNQFNNLIGLDISDSKIRFIQFGQKMRNKYRVVSFSETPVAPGLIRSGEVSEPDTVAALIHDLIRKPAYGKLQSKFVNFSVPEKRSFVKVVSIPDVPDDERAGAIRWAVEQNIPVNIQDHIYDWHPISNPEAQSQGKQQCMIAVAPQTIISTYSNIIRKAGLEPVCAENESIAITRSLIPTHTQPEESIMIVDLGRSRTNIMIYNNGAIQFSSTLEVSGNEMTSAVAHKLSLTFEDAEKIKILYGLDPRKGRGKIKNVLEPLMVLLINKLREYIQYYDEYMLGKKSITKILLTGNVSKLHGVLVFLDAELKLPVERGNSYTNIRVEHMRDHDSASLNTSSYSTAIGLALKKLL